MAKKQPLAWFKQKTATRISQRKSLAFGILLISSLGLVSLSGTAQPLPIGEQEIAQSTKQNGEQPPTTSLSLARKTPFVGC